MASKYTLQYAVFFEEAIPRSATVEERRLFPVSGGRMRASCGTDTMKKENKR